MKEVTRTYYFCITRKGKTEFHRIKDRRLNDAKMSGKQIDESVVCSFASANNVAVRDVIRTTKAHYKSEVK